MQIRYAEMEDVAVVAVVEAECFPPAEAATEKEFIERVRCYGNHFWLLYDAEKLIVFVDGFVTDEGVSDKSTHGNVVWHQMRLSF